jgi:DNA-binding PadR family transcriptional regulator
MLIIKASVNNLDLSEMTFIQVTQLEEVLLKIIITSPSSFSELYKIITELYSGYRNISKGRLCNILNKLIKKKLIIKDKKLHIDSNGVKCKYLYSSTSLAIKLISEYKILADTINYGIHKYSQIKV